jgi:hypothetical protein
MIILDQELNIDKLGWQAGDHFQLKNINGKSMLVKLDPVVAFCNGYEVNNEQ